MHTRGAVKILALTSNQLTRRYSAEHILKIFHRLVTPPF